MQTEGYSRYSGGFEKKNIIDEALTQEEIAALKVEEEKLDVTDREISEIRVDLPVEEKKLSSKELKKKMDEEMLEAERLLNEGLNNIH